MSFSKRKGTIEHTLKARGSYRYVPLSDDVIVLIRNYRKQQLNEIEIFGDRWVENDYVFTGENGGMMGVNTARHWLKRFCSREDISYITPHQFRHYTATTLIGNGVPINIVSEFLGHSNVTTTANIYCDAVMKRNAKSKAMQSLANMSGLTLDFGYKDLT